MRFHIEHVTTYTYNAPAFVEPHLLRFHPRTGPSQSVQNFRLEITPTPQARSDFLDAEGNSVSQVWFVGTTSRLEIRVTMDALTHRKNPYDFLPTEGMDVFPMNYAPDDVPFLAPYFHRPESSPALEAFAQGLAGNPGTKVTDFLRRLVGKLYADIRFVYREHGHPHAPEHTLETRSGTCRDSTLLFIDACRRVGLAARFVSGYQEGDPNQNDRDLHAWAEVFIPGGGWRGYDPTHGLAVADRHIVVAASATALGAAPVTGTFCKTGATATMASTLTMKVEPGPD